MAGMDKKKVLFIDRDGVIVKERQVDSYESIEYIPHVFEALREISKKTDYLLVMVSNQDGVGTVSFPYDEFQGPAERIFTTLRGEGIVFDDVNIDLSMPEDGLPTRKPLCQSRSQSFQNRESLRPSVPSYLHANS